VNQNDESDNHWMIAAMEREYTPEQRVALDQYLERSGQSVVCFGDGLAPSGSGDVPYLIVRPGEGAPGHSGFTNCIDWWPDAQSPLGGRWKLAEWKIVEVAS
jgi:hypothetical protein